MMLDRPCCTRITRVEASERMASRTVSRLTANRPASSASLGSELPGGKVPSRTRPSSASAVVSALPALIGRPWSAAVEGPTIVLAEV